MWTSLSVLLLLKMMNKICRSCELDQWKLLSSQFTTWLSLIPYLLMPAIHGLSASAENHQQNCCLWPSLMLSCLKCFFKRISVFWRSCSCFLKKTWCRSVHFYKNSTSSLYVKCHVLRVTLRELSRSDLARIQHMRVWKVVSPKRDMLMKTWRNCKDWQGHQLLEEEACTGKTQACKIISFFGFSGLLSTIYFLTVHWSSTTMKRNISSFSKMSY